MSKLREKGITLVALVVTIIILLILAGVTIIQIGGNNGLFSKVRKAVEEYKGAQKNEEMIIGEIETHLGAAQDLESEGSSENIKENVASSADVLQGKYFYNGYKWQEGAMTNQGSLTKTVPESGILELDPGYYSGGTITATKGGTLKRIALDDTPTDAARNIDVKEILPSIYNTLTIDNFAFIIDHTYSGAYGSNTVKSTSPKITMSYNSTTGIFTSSYLGEYGNNRHGTVLATLYCYYVE